MDKREKRVNSKKTSTFQDLCAVAMGPYTVGREVKDMDEVLCGTHKHMKAYSQ